MIEVLASYFRHLDYRDQPNVLFLEPHHDDLVLFASYALMSAPYATVKTVLGSSELMRGSESRAAMEVLGLKKDQYEAWPVSEERPDWAEVETRMRMVKYDYDHNGRGNRIVVFAPAVEEDGHEHHNAVGRLADEVFGDACVFYLTYRRGHGRSKSDTEIEPELLGWRAKKLAALACYASQIDREATRPWFASSEIFQEWLA